MKTSATRIRLAVPLLLLLCLQFAWGTARFPVHAIEYPPFVTSDTEEPGITVALLNRLIGPHNAIADMQLLPPARLQSTLNNRDFLASLVAPEHLDNGIVVFRYEGEPVYRRLFRKKGVDRKFSNINGATVARLGFLFQNAENDTTVISGGIPIPVPNFESAVRMLIADRVDFALGVDEAVFSAARELGVDTLIEPSPIIMQTFDPLVLYVNSAHPKSNQLIEVLNRADDLRPIATVP